MTAGLTLDLPKAVKLYTDSASFLRGFLSGFQPINVNFNRSLLSVYDGSPTRAPLLYQFALGGVDTFRELSGELATSAGLVTRFSVNQSINLPGGASIASRYQRINTRNWTRRFDERQEVVDGTQIVFPDISLRWSGKPAGLSSIISSLGGNARMLETRQFNGTQLLAGEEFDDSGRLRVRSFPMSASVVFAGARPLSSTVGFSLSRRLDAKPGLRSSGDNSDFSIDLSKPWGLPADWAARSDLRTRRHGLDTSMLKSELSPLLLSPAWRRAAWRARIRLCWRSAALPRRRWTAHRVAAHPQPPSVVEQLAEEWLGSVELPRLEDAGVCRQDSR